MMTDNDSVRLIFGLKVKALRAEKGLSYQQLAEKTGMSLSYVHDIKSSARRRLIKYCRWPRHLGVDYDYLVSLRASKKLQPKLHRPDQFRFYQCHSWEHFFGV